MPNTQMPPFVPLRPSRNPHDAAQRALLVARLRALCEEIEQQDRDREYWNRHHPDEQPIAGDPGLSAWAKEARVQDA